MVIYKFMKWFKEFGWRHLIGLIFAIISLYPILYVVTNSFADFANLSNSKLIPDGFTTKHYQSLTGDPLIPYYKWLFNTYKIAGIAGFLNVLLGTFAAFAFARLKFKGRRVGLITLVLVQMFPSFLAFVAIYLLFFRLVMLHLLLVWAHIWLNLCLFRRIDRFNSWLIKNHGYNSTPR